MGRTVAEALLCALDDQGVEYFIGGGAGTDFPPIIEAFAKRQAERIDGVQPLTIVHEITAVAMAHGYAMVSGKTPFVMLHTSVGTANGLGGIINATRSRTPIVLAAGRSPITEHGHRGSRSIVIHWAQETFDQGGMLREFVKWDYELRMASQTTDVIDRAFGIAGSDPSGPVYLTLPLEVLSEPFVGDIDPPRQHPLTAARPNAAAVEAVVEVLRGAHNPVLVTSSLGRDPGAVPALVELAERLAMPVIEQAPTHLNFPRDHALHMGYDPSSLVRDADVIVVVDSGTPWYPDSTRLREGARVVQIDEDALYQSYPMRGFSTEFTLTGRPRHALEDLLAALDGFEAPADRLARWSKTSEARRAALVYDASSTPVDPRWVSHCVGELLSEQDILVTEYVLNPAFAPHLRPGGYFNHSHAGGLGWGINAALGAKLARPAANVICCIGDGAYTFGAPVSAHHAAAMHGLGVLFVVFNNSLLNATRRAAMAQNPQGWVMQSESVPFCDLRPSPRYEQVCQAAGGYGEYVDDPAALPGALARAQREVLNGRQALVNVACAAL
ncbi:MAG: thiamine pyrophosphate-requiring protein [Gammaproteobacteria bacterium]|nr:thiamine pyrophosphate-requiring protein [Gammaproteobacteria bacterium]